MLQQSNEGHKNGRQPLISSQSLTETIICNNQLCYGMFHNFARYPVKADGKKLFSFLTVCITESEGICTNG